MKRSIFGMVFLIITLLLSCSAQKNMSSSQKNNINDQEILDLSKEKWLWMANKKTDSLNALFHEKSMFVHMGGSWDKEREIEVIKSGSIWYKKAEVYSASVKFIGNTAILLNDIDGCKDRSA